MHFSLKKIILIIFLFSLITPAIAKATNLTDYTTWLNNYKNKTATGIDYVIWLINFGKTPSPSPTITPSPTPTSPAPVGISGNWALVFDDEFNGTTLDTTKWASSWYNKGIMNNVVTDPANVSVTGGNLILTLSSSNSGALINTQSNNGFEVKPGMYAEAKVYFPGNGTKLYNWPAWWISGTSWPSAGENDIAEVLGGLLTVNYHSPSGSHNQGAVSGYWGDNFHVYGILRKTNSAEVYWDGQLVKSYTTDDNGLGENLILNMGYNSSYPTIYGASSQMKVDYVRVWQPTNSSPILSPTVTSSPTPTITTNPSGESIPTGDIAGWHQIFTDDFNTNVPLGSFPQLVSNKWWAYPDNWQDTSKNGQYYPSKVISINNGVMNLYIHTENGVHLVAAPVPILASGTKPYGIGLQYGRYTIRFKSDSIPGYKTAWLLWPDSGNWPNDGEIDFPEGNLDSHINAFLHHQGAIVGSDQDAYSTSLTYTSWHTATVEWSPTSCKFYLDGNLIGNSTTRIPNTPMHWVIQTETNTSGVVPLDTASGNIQIDWVAAYIPN